MERNDGSGRKAMYPEKTTMSTDVTESVARRDPNPGTLQWGQASSVAVTRLDTNQQETQVGDCLMSPVSCRVSATGLFVLNSLCMTLMRPWLLNYQTTYHNIIAIFLLAQRVVNSGTVVS